MRRATTYLFLFTVALPAALAEEPRVSRFGEYKGYSQPVYDGWERTSFYIPVRDGTRLAVDLFRPTRGGEVATERLPVVWTANRYRRAIVEEGKLYTMPDMEPWLGELIRHGYVAAVVDVRGSGASFGRFQGMFNRQETEDSYDVTEWLGTQPWSSGKVGMFGRSYLAITQYMTASLAPPHLVAIFPEVGLTDQYALLWHGGIFHHGLIEGWTDRIKKIDIETPAPPVDGPEGAALLRAALADHRNNVDMAALAASLPFRDSVDEKTGIRPWIEWSPVTYRKEIERSGVAIYHLAGWFDRYVRDQLLIYRNLRNPQRITIGPWSHVQNHGLDFAAEHLRFYDYWLKGIDNGITKEEPVQYYVMGGGWRSARQWPLPEEKRMPYYFAADGRLTLETPIEKRPRHARRGLLGQRLAGAALVHGGDLSRRPLGQRRQGDHLHDSAADRGCRGHGPSGRAPLGFGRSAGRRPLRLSGRGGCQGRVSMTSRGLPTASARMR